VRFHTLNEWLAWQETLHPKEIELGLERIMQVWTDLHEPVFSCPVISIAGTNGKGSSLAMLQAIYISAGYHVGSYSSPHLYQYNERICIDGKAVDDERIIAAFEKIDQARNKHQPETSLTYFEFGTLAALDIFAHADLDVILLEVGLGGRLDAVNIIDADVALITSIDLDHTAWLGETRDAIAREKAGILRKDKFCVISDPNAPMVIDNYANKLDCHCYRACRDFDYQETEGQWRWSSKDKLRSGLPLPSLNGKHQYQNAAGVLMTLDLLQSRLPVSQQAIRTGLLSASLPGRFEIRTGTVTTVLDVAHNEAAAQALAESIKTYAAGRRILCIFSILEDKNIHEVISPFIGLVAHWSIAPLSTARAMKLDKIENEIKQQLEERNNDIIKQVGVQTHATARDAFEFVQNLAAPDDVILVFGSFHLVAEVVMEHV
jgi:dihydrofolate synthase/folylpolyglutamate synthase